MKHFDEKHESDEIIDGNDDDDYDEEEWKIVEHKLKQMHHIC